MTKEEAIKYLQQLYPNGGHCWLDEQRIEAIGMAVKALQEEPKSKCHGCNNVKGCITCVDGGVWHTMDEEPPQDSNICLLWPRDNIITIGKLNGLKDFRYVSKWAYAESILNLKEEPVSEELEEAATSFARKDSEGISNPANFYYTVADKARIFKTGAKWQKEQFEKNRLKHCDSITKEQAELEQGFIDQHLDKHQLPLTPEILEKNGFKRDPLWHHCDKDLDNYSISVQLGYANRIEYIKITEKGKDDVIPSEKTKLYLTHINYVHELQHALRLCGINKEIEL